MTDRILDVDLLAFERGSTSARRAVVDGVMSSLRTGFVFTSSDLPSDLLDTAYGMLGEFFSLPHDTKMGYAVPGSFGQTGYTGVLVETAADSAVPDWKEMLNWGRAIHPAHPLRRRYPHQYPEQVVPEAAIPGIGAVLGELHDRLAELQQRFLRIIAVGLGAHEEYFDSMTRDGATLSRAIRYPPMAAAPSPDHLWAAPHGDINLITALPRATASGLQVWVTGPPDAGEHEGRWTDAAPPDGYVILNTGLMLERITNGQVPAGWHRVVAGDVATERLSVVQFLHPSPWTILAPLPTCVDASHPQRWAPIEAGALLDQVLWDINLIDRT